MDPCLLDLSRALGLPEARSQLPEGAEAAAGGWRPPLWGRAPRDVFARILTVLVPLYATRRACLGVTVLEVGWSELSDSRKRSSSSSRQLGSTVQ